MSLTDLESRHKALRNERRDLEAEVAKLVTYDRLSGAQESRLIDAQARLSAIRDELEDLREQRIAEATSYAKAHPEAVVGPHDTPFHVNRGSAWSPWTDAEQFRSQTDRALTALERTELPDHGRARLEEMARRDANDAAVVTDISDPALVTAYERFLADPMGAHLSFTADEQRAWRQANSRAMATTGVTGVVPAPYSPQVIATNDGTASPWRQISRVLTTAASTLKVTKSAGLSASFASEAAEVADGSPTLSTVTYTPQRAHAYVQASYEAIEDAPTLAATISEMFADAQVRLESAKFLNGYGDGVPEPWGLLPALQSTSSTVQVLGTSGAASAATLTLADAYALNNALPERYHQQGANWVMSRTIANQLRQLAAASNSADSIWNDLGAGVPPTLLGAPVRIASEMDATVVSGSADHVIIFGAFNPNYTIVDRLPAQVMYVPVIVGSGGHRPTGEAGWYYRWRTTGRSINDAGFRYLTL